MQDPVGATGGTRAGSTGGSWIKGVTALGLSAVGIVVLAVALWALATSLPDVLGAGGTHMAGDAKVYVAIVIVPLAVLAFLLLAAAWTTIRRRRWAGRLAAAAAALAGATVICSVGALALPVLPPETLIPAGTPRVHVSMTDGALTLTPATVSAGPVYLLIDASAGDVSFIGRSYVTQEEIDAHQGGEPGPLTDAEVDAIAHGDTYLTSTYAGLGDVARWDLLPGKYVLVTDDPTILASRGGGGAPAGTLAVLTVDSAPAAP
jgi:hypothetical protein